MIHIVVAWKVRGHHAFGLCSGYGAWPFLHVPVYSRRCSRGCCGGSRGRRRSKDTVQHEVWRTCLCICDHARSSRLFQQILGLRWTHRRIVTKHDSQNTRHVRTRHGCPAHSVFSRIAGVGGGFDTNTWRIDVQTRAIVAEACTPVHAIRGTYSDGCRYIGRRVLAGIFV